MANATIGVTFALYKEQSGGAPLWLETQNVSLDGNGRYSVNLGSNHAGGLPAELFAAGEARWLGVQPEGQPEQPRVLLVSVPYAMKAADADTLGGLPASSYVTAEQLQNQFSVASGQSPVTPHSSTPDSTANVTPSPCTAVTSDGTALANYLTKFTAPCNVENSGLYQSALATTPGFIGIGTTAPQAPLDLEPAAQTGTSGGLYGEHIVATFSPTANSAAGGNALYGQANTGSGNTFNFTGYLAGSSFLAQHYGTGTVTSLYGGNYAVQNRSTGTVTNAVGFYGQVNNLSTGTITNGYGVEVPVPQNSGGGVFTNFYGVYIANPTGITNSWGLYSLANTNYVSGKMGIGVTAPTKSLEINGSIKLDTAGNGITYPDGTVQTTASVPGTGTITKVTAGTDLTGGGSSGGVTLNLDTTKVPTLAATTNTFTGTGGIVATHFSGDGTNVTNVNAAELGGLASSGFAQLAAANTFSNEQTVSGSNSVEMMLVSNDDTTDSGTLSLYAVNYGTDSTAISGEADNGTTSYGVHGTSNSGIGVFGQTSTGYGVYGQYVAGSVERGNCCFAGNAAIWADTNQEFVSGALLATSDSAPAAAFYSTSPLETLWAENDTPVATGVSAVVDAFGLGGSCSTYTNGNLTCTGSLTGVVRNSAQRSLEMYAVQATENWYEDAGSGQLRNGSATVQLDKDFSDLANTGMEYQVFPVPNGDCNGLYVTNKTNSSFEVRELHGGHANIAFDYRVIAKRKGMESLRMQDVSERVQAREALLQKRRQNGAAPVPGRPQPLHRNMQRSSLKESR